MPHKKPKKAMIFGAGLGKRMLPLTNDIPKPLVEVNGKPIIQYALEHLHNFGIEEVVVNTHHKSEKLEQYLSNYSDIKISIIFEPELLDTGGGLLNALTELGTDPFFVINGDIIWLNNQGNVLNLLTESWLDNSDARAMLLLQRVNSAIGYEGNGDFELDTSKNEIKISEDDKKPYVFTGIQIFDPALIKNELIRPFSLIKVYHDQLSIERKTLSGIKGCINPCSWLHVGTPHGVVLAESHIS